MKRMITLLLALLLALGMFGCEKAELQITAEEYRAQLAEKGWESSVFSPHVDYSFMEPWFNGYEYDVRSNDLTGQDLKMEDLKWVTFDSKTVFPQELPEGFDPETEMELGKDPGLSVRNLHNQGITGKGISIGIVDQELVPNNEYSSKIHYYYNPNTETFEGSTHGPAVTSIAVGETCGTAPDARVYYACHKWSDYEDGTAEFYKAGFIDPIHHLLDLNETLPEEEKMVVISVSRGFDETMEIYKEVVARAESQGVWLLTVDELTSSGFAPISRKLNTDYNDLEGLAVADSPYKGIGIPMERRTYASPTGENDFAHGSRGGVSWCEPYLAGIYALAKQVEPELTADAFIALAKETKQSVQMGAFSQPVLNPTGIIEALQK